MLLTRDTIACQVLAEWLEDQTEWLLLVQLTLQKGGFRQGNPMLLKGDSDCCCCCAHKDTALPDGETPWALKDERNPKYAFPEPETSLLKSPTKSLLAAAAAGAADPSKRRLPARKPHATEGRRNVPSEISYKSLLYVSGCWLAASCCTAAVALTDASACVCCCLLMPAAACCCLRLPAACCCLLLPAAVPTKTRPSRTGKHNGPEGRTESKIGVSQGRNVPSEIS